MAKSSTSSRFRASASSQTPSQRGRAFRKRGRVNEPSFAPLQVDQLFGLNIQPGDIRIDFKIRATEIIHDTKDTFEIRLMLPVMRTLELRDPVRHRQPDRL